jgi:hypothetical protein
MCVVLKPPCYPRYAIIKNKGQNKGGLYGQSKGRCTEEYRRELKSHRRCSVESELQVMKYKTDGNNASR